MQENNSFFLEFFKKILPYKWSIISITLIGIIASALNLYFTPSIYEAQAIIKVKTDNNRRDMGELNPLEDIYSSNSENIDQDLALLQIFHIHKKAIEKLNLEIQYYKEDNYRKIELLSNLPIKISNITILDKKIISKYIKIAPQKSNFFIEIKNKSYKHLFNYNKEITTPWFKFKVTKESNSTNPLYVKLNGDSRNIYENIIKKNFNATRLNKNASLIKITFQNNSPKRAISYLNNLMDIYIRESIINKSKQNNKILDFINRQLKNTGQALKNSEKELENFRIKNRVIEPTRQSQTLLDRLSNIEVQLSQIDIEKRLINTISHNIKRKNRDLSTITPTLRELGDEPTIRVIQHLQELERRANELSTEYTPKYPALRAIRRDIRRDSQIIIKNIRQLQKNISQREKNLLELKRKYEKELKILPTKEKELIDLQRNHEVNSKMYSYLLEKQSENNMKRVATVSDYEIIDSAYSNGIPIKPKKRMNLAIATIFSFIFGSLLAYWRSSLVDRLQSAKEIKELTNLPLYAELPILQNSKYLTRDSSQLLKSFRNLRTKINFSHPRYKGNVILVTSSPQREAKTNIASNLGYIFQKADYKTLIIDFDIYNPKVHKAFNLNLGVGVSDYLAGKENSMDILIQKTKYENLDILTAGSIRDDISELVLSKRLYFLIETVKKRYSYIFIDAIPLTMEADVLYIMKYSDVNLITVQEDYTKKSFIKDIQTKIGEYKFNNISILAITNG